MSMFGGTAMNNLIGAGLSLLRSLFAIFSLSGILMGAIHMIPSSSNASTNFALNAAVNNQFSQSVIFSLFCAILVLFAYTLSRQTSDIVTYLKIFKEILFERQNTKKKKNTNEAKENADELVADRNEEIKMTTMSMSPGTAQSSPGSKGGDKTDYLSVPETSRSPTASNTTVSSTRSPSPTTPESSRASSPTCTTNLLERKENQSIVLSLKENSDDFSMFSIIKNFKLVHH